MEKHNSHNSQKNKRFSKSKGKKDLGRIENHNKNPFTNQSTIELNKEQR
jgi:hypothetical protein